MGILVTMQVGPVDFEKFKAADAWMSKLETPGRRSSKIYRAEGDPKSVLVVQEWDSHGSFHGASEKHGDEFNKRAGTEELEWITGVWTLE